MGKKSKKVNKDEEYRKKRERNNVSVRKSREKKRQNALIVEQKVQDLTKENSLLEERVSLLTKEITLLKELLLAKAKSSDNSSLSQCESKTTDEGKEEEINCELNNFLDDDFIRLQ